LVQALLANLQVDEAGRQADELRRQFPEDWQVCLALAEVLLTRRDSQRLTQLLAGIAKGQPGFDQARYLLAMDRVLSRQFAAALRLLDESGEKGYRLGLARAFALANLGRQPEAAELCRTLIRDQPKAQEAYFLLSEVQVATGQTELAIETLRKCLVLGEAFVPALNNLAWLLAQDKNRLPEAVNCIRKAVRLTPGSAAVLDTQARVELQAGNPEQALRAAQAAIEQRPGFWPYYHAAVAAYRSNQLATDFLQKAKELATTKAQEQLLAQWPQTPIEGTAR
jgi:tetratricopeptide (TPR) repeat protein